MESDEHKFARHLAEHLGVDVGKVTPDANLIDDLGADSLDMVEVAMMVEEEFKIDCPDDVIENLQTVQDWNNHIASQRHSAAA
jgi:acyl carrier protein